MPKKLEEQLKKEASKKHFGKKRTGAYVYGTMHNLGFKIGRKITPKRKGRKRL